MVSNSLEKLSEVLANNMKGSRNPFVKQWMMTPTAGMTSWLQVDLSMKLGIVANVEMVHFRDIIWLLYKWAGVAKQKVIHQDIFKWILYDRLGENEFIKRYPNISSYYQGSDIKKIALAKELADLFEQYQIYRTEMIVKWNSLSIDHVSKDDHSDETWQQFLWIRSKEYLKEKEYKDETEVQKELFALLKESAVQQQVKAHMPQLHLFGLAVLPPFYLQVLQQLAKSTNVFLYVVNPCIEIYWFEDRSEKETVKWEQKVKKRFTQHDHITQGNDLLLNWGRLIKETFLLLFEDDDIMNTYDDQYRAEIEHSNILLKSIQADIYHNRMKDTSSLGIEEDNDGISFDQLKKDRSITINGCYTPMREVEVLYNYLVALIDQQGKVMSARDIVVMVSDIDFYAPYIHAIFGDKTKQGKGARAIFPYKIVDEKFTSGNNLFSTIQAILDIDESVFKAESILELFDSPYIRKRFGITDIEAIRRAVIEAKILLSREGRKEDETYLVSWKYGLKKILYGICISGEPMIADDGEVFIPLDTAEGTEAIDRIRLVYFIKILNIYIDRRNEPKRLGDWALYLSDLLDDLILQEDEVEEKDKEEYRSFFSIIDGLCNVEDVHSGKISFEVFKHHILSFLSTEKNEHSFSTGGITFCSLMPMRSIPFKVVAMLGMDFDKFPRKETPLRFSLLSREKRIGDRNIKDNDKHLFLETLMCAKEMLYISYIARSAQDGSTLAPSLLVDQLIDYVANRCQCDAEELRKQWITIHPLHGFSSKYDNKNLISYLSDDLYKGSTKLAKGISNSLDILTDKNIRLDDLISFFKDPPKFYLTKRLGIYYADAYNEIPGAELFELGTLEEYGLVLQLLFTKDEKEKELLFDKKRMSASIPLANTGKYLFKKLNNDITKFKELVRTYTDDPPQSIRIEMPVKDKIISGTIKEVYGKYLVNVCNSINYPKHLIEAYLKYIFLRACGNDINWIFIFKYKDKNKNIEYRENEISKLINMNADEAKKKVAVLIDLFDKAYDDYFYFHPIFAKDKYELMKGADSFYRKYSEIKNNEYRKDFDFDDYLSKAIEDGFVEGKYEIIKKNVATLFGDLQSYFPIFFESNK